KWGGLSFTMLPPRSTAAPKGYRVTGSRANPITNGACRICPPSSLSRTTYMFLLRLPCRTLSLLNSHLICRS
ncbi:hypothetical protein B0H14DRAFT_2767387, partial [Mycena olivaceomarginata]